MRLFGRQAVAVRQVRGGGRLQTLRLLLGGARAGTEDGEKDREEEDAVESAEEDDEDSGSVSSQAGLVQGMVVNVRGPRSQGDMGT